jgi:hypothetical protein
LSLTKNSVYLWEEHKYHKSTSPMAPDASQRDGINFGSYKQPTNSFITQVTKGKPTQSNAIEVPSISLPQGGGALKGIDEKFSYVKSYLTGRFLPNCFVEIFFSLIGYFLVIGFNKNSQNLNFNQL